MKVMVMKIKAVLGLLFLVLIACTNNTSGEEYSEQLQSMDNTYCDSLLNLTIKGTDLESNTYKLIECGLDSADLPLVGGIIIMRMQDKEGFDTLTYRGVLRQLENMKNKHYE